jgi:glycosyltransferase involved in cell wall biosynthesis
MWRDARIHVIVPAYAEERLIDKTLAGIPDFVDEIVVVDDSSPDATGERVRAFGSARVRLVSHSQNRGVGAAIATGYRAALAAGADVLVVMAGDAQMDPADLERVIAPVVDGRADYVKGNRFQHSERSAMPFARRLGGAFLSSLTRLATGLDVDDSQCGYTALSARAAGELPLDELWPRYGYPNDLLLLIAHRGLSVYEVPVRPVYRDEASGVRAWHIATIAGVIARRKLLLARRSPSLGRIVAVKPVVPPYS